MTRAEHVAWAKARALEYADKGALFDAIASLASDLAKHPDARDTAETVVEAFTRAAAGDFAGARRIIETVK